MNTAKPELTHREVWAEVLRLAAMIKNPHLIGFTIHESYGDNRYYRDVRRGSHIQREQASARRYSP